MGIFKKMYMDKPVFVLIDPHHAPGQWRLKAFRSRNQIGIADLDARGIGPWEAAAVVEGYRCAADEQERMG